MYRYFIIFSFLAFSLSSCWIALPRHKQTEKILISPSLDCSIATSISTPYFEPGPWPEKNWWEMFHSPDLNALIAKALWQNPTIQEIQQRITFAAQEGIVARSRLFPSIYFNAIDTWDYLSKNGLYRAFNPHLPLSANLAELHFSLNYEFDFWGKYAHLFYAAIGRELAQVAEAAQVELIITTALTTAYFALKTNLLRKKLYEELWTIRSGIASLQGLLLQHALFSKIPPLLADENLYEAKKLIAVIEAEIAENKHLINVLTGLSPDACLLINEEFAPLPAALPLPCDLSLNLLARRPDLMAQIWRAKALAEEVGAAMTDFYPNVNLFALVGLESVIFSRLFTSNSGTAEVQPALSLPIFTAGRIRANVRGRKALFDEAIFAYNGQLLKSAQEVADLLALATSIYQQKGEQEIIVSNAKKRYDLSVLRKQKKLDSLLNNYIMKEEWVLKELENVRLFFAQHEAIIKLIKALGGGYCVDYVPLQAQI